MLLTREDVQRAIQMRKDGMRIEQIHPAFFVSARTLHNYIERHGLKEEWSAAKSNIMREVALKRHGQKPIPLGPLVTLYERGKTYQEIADFFGCSTRKVFLAIRKYGLHPDIKTHEQDLFTVSKYDR